MDETTNGLRPLCRTLPSVPDAPEMDEDGEDKYRGFMGDISQCPRWVTDGCLMLLASAIDPVLTIEPGWGGGPQKRATETNLRKVWEEVAVRSDVPADFIGARDGVGTVRNLAFLRDERGRVMVVNAQMLAFCIRAASPDALTVAAAEIVTTRRNECAVEWFTTSLALRRNGELVGMMMPMHLWATDFSQDDLQGEPVSLAEIWGAW